MEIEEINIRDIKIETANLILRPFKESDIDDLYNYAKVPGVGEAAGWKHHESKEETEAVLKVFIESHRTFAIEEKSSGKVIGSISLEKSSDIYNNRGLGENINDTGYVIAQDYWGKGYAVEALQGVLSYAFYILHLDAVTCGCFAGNESSKKLLKKCGFKLITEDKYVTPQGAEYDACYYAIKHLDYGVEYSSNVEKQSEPAEQPAEEPKAEEPAPAEQPKEEPKAEEPAPAEESKEEPKAEPEHEEKK